MTVFIDATTAEHARGVGTVIDGVLRELPDDGDGVVVACGSNREISGKARSRRVSLARTRPGRLLYQRMLLPFDVLSLRSRGSAIERVLLLDSYLPLLRPRSSVRYGALIHDVLPLTHSEFWPPTQRAVKSLAFRSLRRANPVLFTSTEHNADAIRELLGAEARVVRFGCGQLTDSAADAARTNPLPKQEPYLVAVGKLEARKNLHLLIDAFERLAPVLPDFRLRLVGAGTHEFEARLRTRIADSPLRSRIDLVPNADATETLTVIANASGLMFPSLAEGFGLPILEALALGTPVVASDLPEIRSWAEGAVRYASPAEPSSWLEPIMAATQATEEERRAEQAFASSYRWRGCAEGLLDW